MKNEITIILRECEGTNEANGCEIQMIGHYKKSDLIVGMARVMNDILETSTDKMLFLDCLIHKGDGFYHDVTE